MGNLPVTHKSQIINLYRLSVDVSCACGDTGTGKASILSGYLLGTGNALVCVLPQATYRHGQCPSLCLQRLLNQSTLNRSKKLVTREIEGSFLVPLFHHSVSMSFSSLTIPKKAEATRRCHLAPSITPSPSPSVSQCPLP